MSSAFFLANNRELYICTELIPMASTCCLLGSCPSLEDITKTLDSCQELCSHPHDSSSLSTELTVLPQAIPKPKPQEIFDLVEHKIADVKLRCIKVNYHSLLLLRENFEKIVAINVFNKEDPLVLRIQHIQKIFQEVLSKPSMCLQDALSKKAKALNQNEVLFLNNVASFLAFEREFFNSAFSFNYWFREFLHKKEELKAKGIYAIPVTAGIEELYDEQIDSEELTSSQIVALIQIKHLLFSVRMGSLSVASKKFEQAVLSILNPLSVHQTNNQFIERLFLEIEYCELGSRLRDVRQDIKFVFTSIAKAIHEKSKSFFHEEGAVLLQEFHSLSKMLVEWAQRDHQLTQSLPKKLPHKTIDTPQPSGKREEEKLLAHKIFVNDSLTSDACSRWYKQYNSDFEKVNKKYEAVFAKLEEYLSTKKPVRDYVYLLKYNPLFDEQIAPMRTLPKPNDFKQKIERVMLHTTAKIRSIFYAQCNSNKEEIHSLSAQLGVTKEETQSEEVLCSSLSQITISKEPEQQIFTGGALYSALQDTTRYGLPFAYDKNVLNWFNPEYKPVVETKKYIGKIFSEEAQEMLFIEHNFALAVDWIVPLFAHKTSTKSAHTGRVNDYYILVGSLIKDNRERKGFFTFCYDNVTQTLYHRFHTKKTHSAIVSEWVQSFLYDLNFPPINYTLPLDIQEKKEKLFSRGRAIDGSYIIESKERSTIIVVDPARNIELKIAVI